MNGIDPCILAESIDDNGLWREIRDPAPPGGAPRPALFLDRDGTLIAESPYLSDPDLVSVITEAGT